MAFDRTSLGWKSLYNPQGKAVAVNQLNDNQILSYLGNQKNTGALAAGWQYKNGQVSRATGAAPVPNITKSPYIPPAGTPAPTNPNAPVGNPFNYAPAGLPNGQANKPIALQPGNPNTVGRFDRSAIKWGALYLPGEQKARSIHTLTDAQVRAALGDVRNKGALAPGWMMNGDRVVKAPTAPAATVANGNEGYFFNPYSDTLWSRLRSDGTLELNAGAPGANDSMLSNMDLVSQYRLPSAGAGNLLPGMSLGDASAYLTQTGWQQGLIRQLSPLQQQLAALADNQGGRGTMYDIGKRDFLNSWDGKVNAAMGNLAARGMYSGGARSNTLANAAQERAQGLLQLDQQYGGLKQQEINNSIEQARRDYGLNALQALLDNLLSKKNADIQGALA